MRAILLPSLLGLPLLAAAEPSTTRSFRCGTDLVNVGSDDRASVLRKCGEPVVKDNFCRPEQRHCDPVDEWTYNPGRGQFWTTLRFENGRLVQIRYGDRV